VALGIGFGAAFPNFKSENPAQTITSYGGMLFMIFSALFVGIVIVLEAGPVYRILYTQFKSTDLGLLEKIWMSVSFGAALIISVLATLLPMRYGEKQLRRSLFGER
jgi:ABC-2 type transport system permease protein